MGGRRPRRGEGVIFGCITQGRVKPDEITPDMVENQTKEPKKQPKKEQEGLKRKKLSNKETQKKNEGGLLHISYNTLPQGLKQRIGNQEEGDGFRENSRVQNM